MNSFQRFTSQEIVENRLQLKVSIDATRWLAFQGYAFRGDDESNTSINHGNILELLSLVGSCNDKVAEVIDKAPKNATYTSSEVQKRNFVSHDI